MIPFEGLYWKELKISFFGFIIGFILIDIAAIAAITLKNYFNAPMIPAVIFFIVFVLHIFYLPALLFHSLQIEAQSQLWLHTTFHGAKLFLGKLLACLTYFIFNLIFTIILTKLSLNNVLHLEQFSFFKEKPWGYLFLFAVSITFLSVYLSFWLIFYWSLYHALKSNPSLRFFRFPIVIAVWVGLTLLGIFIENSSIYKDLLSYGSVNLGVKFSINQLFFIDFNLIGILFFLITIVIIFIISVWLLERKVEV